MEVLSLIVCIITAHIYDEQIQLKVDSPQSQFLRVHQSSYPSMCTSCQKAQKELFFSIYF